MTTICLYFRIHVPSRLKTFEPKEVGTIKEYQDNTADEELINKLSDECYLPVSSILLQQAEKPGGAFKINFSISGTTLLLLNNYRPDVIACIRKLTNAGYADILGETFYHSLSSVYSASKFRQELLMHRELVEQLFNITPSVFRNTELIHNNHIAQKISEMGYDGLLCEGIDRLLKGRSPNKVYKAPGSQNLSLLLRNFTLSDDIAFRFNDSSWCEHPLTAAKFAEWLHRHPESDSVINLFMDYETFGIHKKASSGIFEFLEELPSAVLSNKGFSFSTAREAIKNNMAEDVYDVPDTISWNDKSKDACVVCENAMQNNSIKKIYSLEKQVEKANDRQLAEKWSGLLTADYFYYMAENAQKKKSNCTNPFESPRDAYRNYLNIITDFELSLIQKGLSASQYAHYDSAAGLLY